MQQRNSGQKRFPWTPAAFLLNLVIGIAAFGWVHLMQEGLFSIAGDFNVQQIPFAMYANDAIKSGNVVWDWSLDLGSNFIGGQTFYILGNPSFWLSLLFPASAFQYIVGWMYVLKYALAGMTSFMWIRRSVRDPRSALIASVMYAFSGFMATNLLFYHFHDVVWLFPLLPLTLDLLIEENRHGPFIIAVALNLLVNYFFFPGDVMFLAAYFILRHVMDSGRSVWKKLPEIIGEGILGCLITCVLMVPAAIFTLQNPRVKFDYVGSNSVIFSEERYLFILKGLLFPGEVMSDQSAVINHNFSSCNAYIPMCGLVLVTAFILMNRKHWITRMLKWCLVMIFFPILNASFSLFAGLYHRWFYMPILLFAFCGALVLDRLKAENRSLESPTPAELAIMKGMLIWLATAIGFILFFEFVPWSSSDPSKIYREDLFVVWSAVCVGGTILTGVVLTRCGRFRYAIFSAGVILFAVGTTIAAVVLYHDANGEDAVHLHDRIVTSAEFDLPDLETYRFTNRDNPETLTHGYMASANFCSTVSGSIFRFYQTLGLKRDVKSPEAPVGLNELVSAKYTYSAKKDEEIKGTFLKEVKGRYKTYRIFENESVAPIGFTYDTYMKASDFSETPEGTRAVLMLKTLVIPDDQEEEVSKVLREYDAFIDGDASAELLDEISEAHKAEASRDVARTTDSWSSTITASEDKYAFFSIPNDSGWKCRVNGQETKILDINGFMAVPVSKGDNRIEFHYTIPGFATGLLLSFLGTVLSAVWVILFAVRGRKRTIRRK